MKRIFSALIVALLGAMGTGMAEQSADIENPRQLADSIIVTANRVGINSQRSVWPAVIINAPTLALDGNLENALDGQAGLDVRGYNGFGSLATLSNWGTFNRHMLLLYNGRAVKDYSLGGFNLSDFSSDELERIEILKGPQSAFYGSDAVGGVVNLITRSTLADRVDVSLRQGTQGYQHYHVNVSRRLGSVGVGGYAEYSQADNNRDNAGSKRALFDVRSDYLSGDGRHHLSLTARYFDDSLGVPGPSPDPEAVPVYGSEESWSLYDHQRNENYSADLQYKLDDPVFGSGWIDLFWEKKNLDYNSLYNYLLPYNLDGDTALYVDSVDVFSRSIFNKRSFGASGRYSRRLSISQISGGVDFLSGSIRATTDDQSLGTNIIGTDAPWEWESVQYSYWRGAQDQFDIWASAVNDMSSSFQLDLSGRVQFVKNREMQPSYNLGLVYSPEAPVSFKVGYAYAYRLPTIVEQFAENVFTPGNDKLKPETSRSIVGTVTLRPDRDRWSAHATVFYQAVDSLIQYQYDPSSFHFVPRNVNRFRAAGVDFGVRYNLTDKHRMSLGGVVQKAEQTLELSGDWVEAFYVPDIKWRLGATGAVSRFDYNCGLGYTSHRSIIQGGVAKTIEPVYELNLTVAAAITPSLKASLSGYDLTDRKRPDQFGFSSSDRDYPSPGRRFVVGLRYGIL